mmetsp:Transcript_42789/g.50167  ORF Transcript_42789/g.50167 Transcript_42789/m.50167 type:complete len:235 (-) Transcript_42789:19-723(-)
MLISQDLEFNVSWLLDVLLNQDPVISERGKSFIFAQFESFNGFLVRVSDSHAFAAAARRSLDHDGVPDFVRNLDDVGVVLDLAEEAGHGVDVRLLRKHLRLELVAHRGDGRAWGTDELHIVVLEHLLELSVFGQESVSGVHGLGPALLHDFDDLIHEQVRLVCRGRPDTVSFISFSDKHCMSVCVRVHSYGFYVHFFAGFNYSSCDFSSVCNQDLIKGFWVGLRGCSERPSAIS